jgi:ABC-type Fe3+/spermidine/putrescine transport system ATPase subunit
MNAQIPRDRTQVGTSPPAVSQFADGPPDAVRLDGVAKAFGSFVAVRDVNLSLRKGSLTSLLGPSGCGKTTLLRLIAGLETASRGEIAINGRSVGNVAIHKRNIGLVFQNYALFPHKTVAENIGFGLKYRGVAKAEMAAKIKRALDVVRLPGMEERYPNQLSGGQQQRIALARAVVFEPDVLLLDEPLSALDANLRDNMRVEIKLIQKALGLTTILVTHDQQEALAMSDEIVVMNQGVVQQIGDPKSVYRFPRNRFVAGFLGQANICGCEVLESAADTSGQWRVRLDNGTELWAVPGGETRQMPVRAGDRADVVIRGSDMKLSVSEPRDAALPGNRLAGSIVDSSYLGDDTQYVVDVGGTNFKLSQRTSREDGAGAGDLLRPGTRVFITVARDACAILGVS